MNGVRSGLRHIDSSLRLRGPAGLFRTSDRPPDRHPLCWGVLSACNANRSACPIDTITFHRKGADGSAASIVAGSIELIATFGERFDHLRHLPYANSEADPTTGWSRPLRANGDVRYAAVLVETVLLHWSARVSGRMGGLSGLSHDNAFVSWHPHEFEQRTLLARFRMNRTGGGAPDEQMFEKPVYAAWGLMVGVLNGDGGVSDVGASKDGCIWVASRSAGGGVDSDWLASVLVVSGNNSVADEHDDRESSPSARQHTIRIVVDGVGDANSVVWLGEYLEHRHTDPQHIWLEHGRPDYPGAELRDAMRAAQVSRICIQNVCTAVD